MEYPVFDIPYKDDYSTTIEFKTEIKEKLKGHEQRYPVWTYPKRIFTLKFEKNTLSRKKLEEFFISVMGQAQKFLFTWEKSKGGNGKTYLCNFETDSLQQSIKEFGYSETELKFSAIEDAQIEQVDELDFYHNAECDSTTEFYTLLDSIFTFRNNRLAFWDTPKKSWRLKFQKNAKVRKQLEDFFIAKRGQFRSFQWTWKKEYGGDGKTYTVRFNNDSLNIDINTFGYGELELELKEVFPNSLAQIAYEKDEIIPRKLLKILLEEGSVYILDNETLATLRYENEDYIGAPLSFGDIKKDDNNAISKLNIELSNVGLAFSGIIGQRGDVITNAPAVLTLVFLDVNKNTIIEDYKQVLFAGKCNNIKLDYETASMDIETALGGYEIQAPIMKFRTTCQVRRFKDCRCGYAGAEEKCDRTFDRCKELGNEANFRGYPQMYNELVIKV